jgi:LytS/YehU family sensor histidine kinase
VTALVLRLAPRVGWPVHIVVGALVAGALAAWNAALTLLFDPYRDLAQHTTGATPGGFGRLWLDDFLNSLLGTVVLYTAILVVRHVVEQRARVAAQETRSARLGERLALAQLETLRHQIEPHFLFNTLNAVASLVRANRNDAAVTMIAELGAFLRATLEAAEHHEVPLAAEMALAEQYLAIQRFRFPDRLRVTVDLPAELSHAAIPQLILQPLIENAVEHGIAKRVAGGEIHIAALRRADTLVLRVRNDGPKLSGTWDDRVGLTNVRARLKSLYGDAGQFCISDRDGGVEAVVSVPFRDGKAVV